MKDSFKLLSGMSQEMRSYMNSIVGFTYLIDKNCIFDEENKEYSSQILHSCNQLIWLFDSYLNSAIIDIGNSEVNLKRCRLNNLINALVSELREEMILDDNRRIVILNKNQCLDFPEVFIDSIKVLKVIRTLIQNALNNSRTGDIKIGYDLIEGGIIFYVLDPGKGHLKFKEFLNTENIDISLARYDDPNSAINITLAKKIVHLLGGQIWIADNNDNGAGVYFSLPVQVTGTSEIPNTNLINSLSSRLNSSVLF